jgi:hypothetical protein
VGTAALVPEVGIAATDRVFDQRRYLLEVASVFRKPEMADFSLSIPGSKHSEWGARHWTCRVSGVSM